MTSASAGGERHDPQRSGALLPLEAKIEPSDNALLGGWEIRLPLRAEHVTVTKQPFVVEEVVVRRRPVEDEVQLQDTIQRERLRVATTGDVEVTQPIDPTTSPRDDSEWTKVR